MAESEKNARRSDEAERSRHISATESVAFATMLLGLLNDSDTALHRLEHEGEARAAAPAVLQAHSAETAAVAPAPADVGPNHEEQHAATVESPADISPALHADATAVPQQDAGAALADAPSGAMPTTEAFTSSPTLSALNAATDHASSTGASSASAGIVASPSLDLGATVHTVADTVTGIVDTTLATVSGTIASLTATVTQLTSTVSDTINHLTDGLLGTVTGGTPDTPAAAVVEPLMANLLAPALSPVDTATHGVSLLDTAGAIPTSLLHPLPLQLGFLGQPTMDGHEPHDGAFSALGIHHF